MSRCVVCDRKPCSAYCGSNIEDLGDEIERLKAELDWQYKELLKRRKEVRDLQAENEKLKSEKEELLYHIPHLDKTKESASKEIEELKTENEKLKAKIKSYCCCSSMGASADKQCSFCRDFKELKECSEFRN